MINQNLLLFPNNPRNHESLGTELSVKIKFGIGIKEEKFYTDMENKIIIPVINQENLIATWWNLHYYIY